MKFFYIILLTSIVSQGGYATDETITLKGKSCWVKFNGVPGVYSYFQQDGKLSLSCKELSSLLQEFTMREYSPVKVENNNAEYISFGNKTSGQCTIALQLDNGKLSGTPYGDRDKCKKVTGR